MTVTRRVGDIADVFNGKTPAKADQRVSGFPVLKIKDVNAQGQFSGEFQSFVDDRFAQRHKAKCLRTDDILVLNAAHNADYVGSKQYLAEHSVEGSLATGEWLIARSKSEDLNQRYLWHWFQSPQTRFKFKKIVKGIHLYPKDVADQLIALPPIEEQRRIAAILDKADVIRRKRQQVLTLADDFLRSTFLEMFGSPLENPKGFPVQPLKELIDPKRPITYGILKPGADVPGGVPYVRVIDMSNGQINVNQMRRTTVEIANQYRRSSLKSGDLLMSIRGHVGRLALVSAELEGANITQDTARLAAVGIRNTYLFGCIGSASMQHYMERFIKGAAVKGINLGDVKELPIPVPSVEMQRAYEKIEAKAMSIALKSRAAFASSDSLFRSLSQKAFCGEL